jgi:hypothetical protein
LRKSPKVLSGAPVTFGRFEGTSWIFDNPGNSLKPHECGLLVLACDLNDPRHALYRSLREGLNERLKVVQIMDRYNFRPLPPRAMHVTVCDHVNPFNIDELASPAREEYRSFLKALPASLVHPPPGLLPPAEFFPALKEGGGIRFRYKRMEILMKELALVVLVEPSDAKSRKVSEQISALRGEVDKSELARIGKPPTPAREPHVTLGYFTSEGYAEAARKELVGWDEKLRDGADAHTIDFRSEHLYAFGDMTEFLRLN